MSPLTPQNREAQRANARALNARTIKIMKAANGYTVRDMNGDIHLFEDNVQLDKDGLSDALDFVDRTFREE